MYKKVDFNKVDAFSVELRLDLFQKLNVSLLCIFQNYILCVPRIIMLLDHTAVSILKETVHYIQPESNQKS